MLCCTAEAEEAECITVDEFLLAQCDQKYSSWRTVVRIYGEGGWSHFAVEAIPHSILLHFPMILSHFPIDFDSFPHNLASFPHNLVSFPHDCVAFLRKFLSHFPILF